MEIEVLVVIIDFEHHRRAVEFECAKVMFAVWVVRRQKSSKVAMV